MHIKQISVIVLGTFVTCYGGYEEIDLAKIVQGTKGTTTIKHACFTNNNSQLVVSTNKNELYLLTIDDHHDNTAKQLTDNLYPGYHNNSPILRSRDDFKGEDKDVPDSLFESNAPSDSIKKMLMCGDTAVVISDTYNIIYLVDIKTGAKKIFRPYQSELFITGVKVFSDSVKNVLLVLDDRYAVNHVREYDIDGVQSVAKEVRLLLPAIRHIKHVCAINQEHMGWQLALVQEYDLNTIYIYQVNEGHCVRTLELHRPKPQPIGGVLFHPGESYELVSVDINNTIMKWNRLQREPQEITMLETKDATKIHETHGFYPKIIFLDQKFLCAAIAKGFHEYGITIFDVKNNTIVKKITLTEPVKEFICSPSGKDLVVEYNNKSVLYKNILKDVKE